MKIMTQFLLCSMLILTSGFSLPIKRSIEYSDNSGKSWRESGVMPASFVASQQAWEVALRRDGWRFIRVIGIDSENHKHLEVWQKNKATLMLCLWSSSPSETGYMWGIKTENSHRKRPSGNNPPNGKKSNFFHCKL